MAAASGNRRRKAAEQFMFPSSAALNAGASKTDDCFGRGCFQMMAYAPAKIF
jgi:hypothetical protein